MKISECAEVMLQQERDGKKDRYIEITQSLLNIGEEVKKALSLDCLEEAEISLVEEYLGGLLDTIEHMDFQIYELYRSLQDSFRVCAKLYIKKLYGESYVEDGSFAVSTEHLAKLLDKSCDMGILNREHYEEYISGGKKADVVPGSNSETISSDALGSGRIKTLWKTARAAVMELEVSGNYETKEVYAVYLNDKLWKKVNTVVFSLNDLMPDTDYDMTIVSENGTVFGRSTFTTTHEAYTLNVKDFGAAGDGLQDDTKFIQAAIMACPMESRVLVPAGTYRITSLFLKSDLRLELAEGAELLALTDRAEFVKLPAVLESFDEADEYHLGSWEGNPLPMFAGIISGINASNIEIYGKGTINGNASKENWWKDPKKLNIAYRPRLFSINHCKNVVLQGVTCKNSPSWTLHPFFSDDLGFYNVTVQNPSDSPNTDGLDPESCKNVEIAGVKFSLGDDCIAVKSGKIYMGKKYKTPSENLHIRHCLMENGHGAVTLGSEMAGGVKNLVVEDCDFSHTDRGLRIKTRRGRGKDAILDNIIFRNIQMDHVMTPFVVNSFYFCDPDGKTEYVQSREAYPVDDRTPQIRRLIFEDIEAKNCHVAAAHFDGLPEQKIEEIVMKNVHVTYAENPKKDVPAMSEGVEACTKKGIFANNIKSLVLENVVIEGQEGEAVALSNVDKVR